MSFFLKQYVKQAQTEISDIAPNNPLRRNSKTELTEEELERRKEHQEALQEQIEERKRKHAKFENKREKVRNVIRAKYGFKSSKEKKAEEEEKEKLEKEKKEKEKQNKSKKPCTAHKKETAIILDIDEKTGQLKSDNAKKLVEPCSHETDGPAKNKNIKFKSLAQRALATKNSLSVPNMDSGDDSSTISAATGFSYRIGRVSKNRLSSTSDGTPRTSDNSNHGNHGNHGQGHSHDVLDDDNEVQYSEYMEDFTNWGRESLNGAREFSSEMYENHAPATCKQQ